jgi:putative ABC transport system permease protein
MFRKRPGSTTLAVVALALGIGLTTTMFSIVQGVVLRGLPFEESERILSIATVTPASGNNTLPVRLHDVVDWQAQQQSFESLEILSPGQVTVTGPGAYPERYQSARVSPGTFRMLRVAPAFGRDFRDADAAAGAEGVVIIGDTVWQTRFQSRPDVLGEVLFINGTPHTIVGVMPPTFRFPESQDLWMPYTMTLPAARGEGPRVSVVGRLKAGVSEAQATTEMAGIANVLAQQHPDNRDLRARVEPYVRQFIGSEVVAVLFTMLGAVLGVMLIACVNVTNLQLARAADRMKEMAVRTALGSSRWRIIRQLLIEGLLLSAAGAVIGLAIAQLGVTLFSRAIVDTNPPFWIDVRIDTVVLVFVTAIAVLAALVASLVPGWRAAGADVNAGLKDDSRGATSLRMGRFSRGLIIVEVAVSCLLLVVSGLMIRSIIATSTLEYPFPTQSVLFGQIALDTSAFPSVADVPAVYTRIEEAVSRVPGVATVALGTSVPRPSVGSQFEVEGEVYASPAARPRTGLIHATPSYFDVLEVAPLLGRSFNAGDTGERLRVAIVDQAFVAKHFRGEPPLGKRFRFGAAPGATTEAPWVEIVGVVPNLAQAPRTDQVTEMVYLPLAQSSPRYVSLFARAANDRLDPVTLVPDVRRALIGVHESLPLTNTNSLEGELWRRGWAPRVFGGLFLTFGLAALVLAAAGLYGVMAFSVHQRTPEIGVRMAMGADRRGVLRMILRQGLWRVAVGVAIGIVPGWQVGRLMGELVVGVSPADPLVHVTTVVTLMTTGALACLVPALRAASVSPVIALRGD